MFAVRPANPKSITISGVPIINFMDSPAICKYKDWYLGDRRQCDYAGLVAAFTAPIIAVGYDWVSEMMPPSLRIRCHP